MKKGTGTEGEKGTGIFSVSKSASICHPKKKGEKGTKKKGEKGTGIFSVSKSASICHPKNMPVPFFPLSAPISGANSQSFGPGTGADAGASTSIRYYLPVGPSF
jgi:hypothetical protein